MSDQILPHEHCWNATVLYDVCRLRAGASSCWLERPSWWPKQQVWRRASTRPSSWLHRQAFAALTTSVCTDQQLDHGHAHATCVVHGLGPSQLQLVHSSMHLWTQPPLTTSLITVSGDFGVVCMQAQASCQQLLAMLAPGLSLHVQYPESQRQLQQLAAQVSVGRPGNLCLHFYCAFDQQLTMRKQPV